MAIAPSPTADSAAPPPGRRDRGAWLFLLPNAVGFVTFTLVPVLAAFLLSFTRWDAVESWRGIHFVGLANYAEILGFASGPEGLAPGHSTYGLLHDAHLLALPGRCSNMFTASRRCAAASIAAYSIMPPRAMSTPLFCAMELSRPRLGQPARRVHP